MTQKEFDQQIEAKLISVVKYVAVPLVIIVLLFAMTSVRSVVDMAFVLTSGFAALAFINILVPFVSSDELRLMKHFKPNRKGEDI